MGSLARTCLSSAAEQLRLKLEILSRREREWNWGGRPFKLKYHNSHKEFLVRTGLLYFWRRARVRLTNPPSKAIPTKGSVADTVRFTTHRPHLMHNSQHAVLYFPHQMRDELERMFLLLAILQTEIHRQDMVCTSTNCDAMITDCSQARQRNGTMADMAASGACYDTDCESKPMYSEVNVINDLIQPPFLSCGCSLARRCDYITHRGIERVQCYRWRYSFARRSIF